MLSSDESIKKIGDAGDEKKHASGVVDPCRMNRGREENPAIKNHDKEQKGEDDSREGEEVWSQSHLKLVPPSMMMVCPVSQGLALSSQRKRHAPTRS